MSVLSGFLNHCIGVEGIHDSGDLCKYGQFRQAKGVTRASPGTHPTLETTNNLVSVKVLKYLGVFLENINFKLTYLLMKAGRAECR